MVATNSNKIQVHTPVWELMNQAPTATATLSSLATTENGDDRFIYYLTGSAFYRYDTWADNWQQLATPNVAPLTVLSMRYTGRRGLHGRVLSATATTIQIGGLRGKSLDGKTVSILRGTGLGQERTLTYSSETVHDFGVITGTTTATLADSTKKWKFNQWAGYIVGITFGTGVTQYKEIIYNDATTLYIADANLMPHIHWDNQAFQANAPYALPVTTAGSQSHYQITSQTFTVPAWTINPDYTSFYTTTTGGIYLLSSAAAAPFFTFQYYDILGDNWQTKTVPQSLILAALGTDFSIERLAQITAYLSSTATAGAARTLTDTVQSMAVDRYKNFRIEITGGTGIGQTRRIVCNTASIFTIERNWDINPDITSTYKIWGNYNYIMLVGGAAAAMYGYNPKYDYWMQGSSFDNGVTNNIAVTMKDWEPIGVTSGARIALGVQAINPVPTVGGTGYLVGDILTCSVGGTGCRVIVTGIAPTGIVSTIELVASGTATGFAIGTGKATTGGIGTGCTIEITVVGPTVLVITATANWFKTGDVVTFSGCTSAGYNAAHTILGAGATTTFDVATLEAASMAASNSQSTTVIVDPTQNWVVNEHVGRLVHLMIAGTAPTSQIRWITANTATTLTVATIVAGGNGTSKYVIYDSKMFGHDDQYKQANRQNYGHASGGSATTLIDSSKSWVVNQWAGYRLRIEAGTGFGSGIISITSNTETTLTYAAQGFTPDTTSHYEIADSWGLATASTITTITETTTKNWIVNQWAGKRIKIIAGLQAAIGQEATITSNTATALTTGTIVAGDATSVYTILGIPVRGAGIELIWIWGNSDVNTKGRYIICARGGGSNTFDIYDIPTEKWLYGYFYSPQQETLSTGSSYSYDGADKVLFTKAIVNLNPRVFAYNIATNAITGGGQPSDTDSTLIIGNRMEVIKTTDGLKFLYLMQNTGTKMWRTLFWW